jgi:hypothetical protein
MIMFGVWAPSEAVFWDSWQAAGIVDAERRLQPGYTEMQIATSWPGIVVKTPAVMDGMTVVTPAVLIPGWHTNVRVFGSLAQQFTAGLPQTDAQGKLLPLFTRTRAAQVFGLTPQAADPVTLFPAGYRNLTGVTYCDVAEFKTPSNVWA